MARAIEVPVSIEFNLEKKPPKKSSNLEEFELDLNNPHWSQ
jgi:hypothetical protein